MSLPVMERIAQDVADTLAGVTEANGYHYNLTVQRPTRKPIKPTHLLAVVEQDDPEESELDAVGKDAWRQGFTVMVCILPPEEDATPIDTYINLLWSDMAKALMTDPTRGGLAFDTKIRPPRYFAEVNGELNGFQFHLDVEYRTDNTDPYTLAT